MPATTVESDRPKILRQLSDFLRSIQAVSELYLCSAFGDGQTVAFMTSFNIFVVIASLHSVYNFSGYWSLLSCKVNNIKRQLIVLFFANKHRIFAEKITHFTPRRLKSSHAMFWKEIEIEMYFVILNNRLCNDA